jgi:hypothetical protein
LYGSSDLRAEYGGLCRSNLLSPGILMNHVGVVVMRTMGTLD